MSLPIFKGYPHTTSILRDTGIERLLDYHPTYKTIPDLTYAGKFIENHCGGVYFKWLNRKGGYDYWLFSNVYSLTKTTKSKGNILNNFTDRASAISHTHNIGKESNNSLNLFSRTPLQYMNTIIGIVESPEVYMYTKDCGYEKFNANYCDWVKVSLPNGGFRVYNSKNNTQSLRLRIDLPEIMVQSIV